jgi:hypothetical protein
MRPRVASNKVRSQESKVRSQESGVRGRKAGGVGEGSKFSDTDSASEGCLSIALKLKKAELMSIRFIALICA